MSMAWVETGEPREDAFFRYTVRCDRATAKGIARAARKAGMSETAFVQAHFDAILKPKGEVPKVEQPQPAPARALRDGPGALRPDDSLRAADLGVPLAAVRLARVASAVADLAGVFENDTAKLSEATGIPRGNVTRTLLTLVHAGRMERLTTARPGEHARFRILAREV